MPSYPSTTQVSTVNSIYYAVDDPSRPRSHESGVTAGSGPAPVNGLLLIQGPLVPTPPPRLGLVVPAIENGCIQGNQPATIGRLAAWLKAAVQVPTRPDWYFVKLHTHGLPRKTSASSSATRWSGFHRDLALAEADPDFHYHYVTAREMANLVKAAEGGWTGTVDAARDYRLVFGGASQRLR